MRQRPKSILDEIKEKENDIFGSKGTAGAENSSELPSSPVLQLCARIQNELLKKAAPALYNHLMTLAIEPQFYALRWVRLMFGREFHIEDVLLLWDDMFATAFEPNAGEDGLLPSRLAHIAVAMLMYIENYLLDSDYTRALQRLMRYPPTEDVRAFLIKSTVLRRARQSGDFSAFATPDVSRRNVTFSDSATSGAFRRDADSPYRGTTAQEFGGVDGGNNTYVNDDDEEEEDDDDDEEDILEGRRIRQVLLLESTLILHLQRPRNAKRKRRKT